MDPNITKLIDLYLSGELSDEDRAVFEQRIQTHPELKQEVELQQSIYEAAKRTVARQKVEKAAKNYHVGRWLRWGGLGLIAVVLTVASISAYNYVANTHEGDPERLVPMELQEKLNDEAQLDGLKSHYYSIPVEGNVVLSEDGILVSVPKHAFLKNGKVYEGESIIQFQEALKASDIVKAGLSTMSGDRLLETQGMMALQAFTPQGELLEFNPKVGVYVQVPVDEYKEGMQLFDGVKQPNGTINWQNPEPLEKKPIPVDMADLNFYPEGYEDFLNDQKWKRSKKSRDSLYLSFEENVNVGVSQSEQAQLTDELYSAIADSVGDSYAVSMAAVEDVSQFPYICPSSVLGFWNKRFNNTNLSTREFERRMQAIHATCNNEVLTKYTDGLDRPIHSIDAEVAKMGYGEFDAFANEQVGRVNVSDAHYRNLKQFYAEAVNQLQANARKLAEREKQRQQSFDKKVLTERRKEYERTVQRNAQNLSEEFQFNLKDVYRQLGKTVGFTLGVGAPTSNRRPSSASAVKNIDRYVWDATIARKTTVITDPETGKTAQITYNAFSFEVEDAAEYLKLYAYLFPHELNSFHRIDSENGTFNYPLNNGIIYDLAIVGLTEDGFEYFQKLTFKSGELGKINLEKISERKLEASIEQLNSGRISKPLSISDELDWLFLERANYREQSQRLEMKAFRENVAKVLFPCYQLSESGSNPLNFFQ